MTRKTFNLIILTSIIMITDYVIHHTFTRIIFVCSSIVTLYSVYKDYQKKKV